MCGKVRLAIKFLHPYHNDLFQYRTSDFNHPTHSPIYTAANNKELVFFFKMGYIPCLPKTRRNYNMVHFVKNMMTTNGTKMLCLPIRKLIVSYMSNIQALIRVHLDVWNKAFKNWSLGKVNCCTVLSTSRKYSTQLV